MWSCGCGSRRRGTFHHSELRRSPCYLSDFYNAPSKCLVYHSRGIDWRYALNDDSADDILYPAGETVYEDIVELGIVNFGFRTIQAR